MWLALNGLVKLCTWFISRIFMSNLLILREMGRSHKDERPYSIYAKKKKEEMSVWNIYVSPEQRQNGQSNSYKIIYCKTLNICAIKIWRFNGNDLFVHFSFGHIYAFICMPHTITFIENSILVEFYLFIYVFIYLFIYCLFPIKVALK